MAGWCGVADEHKPTQKSVLVIIFKQSSNPALILTYAAAEGVLLGAITGAFQSIKGYEG